MKWKNKGKPKQSISSVTSMSFLSDENLTFHRFSDGTISFNSERKKSTVNDLNGSGSSSKMNTLRKNSFTPTSTPIWTTNTKFNNYSNNINNSYHHNDSTSNNDPTNDFTFIGASTTNQNNQTVPQNGSTVKLLPTKAIRTAAEYDDQTNKQSRSSIFRGVILCLCLNLTYANIVRFPRELQQHGSAFLVPYLVLLFLIGLPTVLLEISLGQFLGQGSANIWRAAPFLKGASLVGRIASWLAAIWTSMQSVIALLYIGMLSFKTVPFRECTSNVKIDPNQIHNGYDAIKNTGQECLKLTFLRPVWRNSLYFGLLSLALILLWVIAMVCTHCGKMNRRSIYVFGFLTLILLVFETGWEITKAINDVYFPELWPFNPYSFRESNIWFSALTQVIFSLNIGIGALPVITGKFLYKGDAVKTSFVYLCFNILITAIAVAFYILQFNNPLSIGASVLYPELTTLTVIYDHTISNQESDPLLVRLIPGLSYGMIVISSIVSIIIYIYTSTRMIRRHPNYTICLAGLVVAIAGLLCPNYIFSRVLDSRIVGSVIICAMAFEIISIIWVYGSKNLYTDLEFSLGRPVLKLWIFIWALIPLGLIGLLTWWSITFSETDLLIKYIPRWLPIVISLALIVILACVEISKQVDYNICSMIQGATKPSKDWGPADPLVRHAWKQWKSVCEDTGERDFTLRRRGTKDYTNSIKKGQYSHSNKYGSANRNLSTPGSNSPNYSGSVFGDSAIEEDMSVDKFPQYKQQNGYSVENNNEKSPGASNSSRKSSRTEKRTPSERSQAGLIINSRKTSENSYTSRIEIMPEEAPYRPSIVRNPMAKVDSNPNYGTREIFVGNNNGNGTNNDHICWRKFNVNAEEFSTEL